MTRQLLVAVALAVLIATAGCADFIGSGETTPETESAVTPTNQTTQPPAEYPAGFSAQGITDVETAVMSHRAATYATGSWTLDLSQTSRTQNTTQTITDRWEVNHEGRSVLRTLGSGPATQVIYLNESESYLREQYQNQTSYSYSAVGYNSSRAVQTAGLTRYLSSMEYTYTSTHQQNGTEYYVYTSTGVRANSSMGQTDALQNLTSMLTVADDGRITDFEVSTQVTQAGNPTTEVTIAFTVSEYGATTVSEPPWLSTAQDATMSNSTRPPETTPSP